jgi:hypothetical protein
MSVAQLLARWDEVWLEYLDQFVCWKSADAGALVADLISMAIKLEVSMMRKVGGGCGSAGRAQFGWAAAAQGRVTRDRPPAGEGFAGRAGSCSRACEWQHAVAWDWMASGGSVGRRLQHGGGGRPSEMMGGPCWSAGGA